MKHLLLFISMFSFMATVLSQDTKKSITYNRIVLSDSVNETKVLAFTFWQTVILYFRESAIKRLAEEYKYVSTSKTLDSIFSKSDTITFNFYPDPKSSFNMEIYILLSSELFTGNVKIWLRKEGIFADNIYYYLDRSKLMTDIIYCLPNKISFYTALYSVHTGGLYAPKRKHRKHNL